MRRICGKIGARKNPAYFSLSDGAAHLAKRNGPEPADEGPLITPHASRSYAKWVESRKKTRLENERKNTDTGGILS